MTTDLLINNFRFYFCSLLIRTNIFHPIVMLMMHRFEMKQIYFLPLIKNVYLDKFFIKKSSESKIHYFSFFLSPIFLISLDYYWRYLLEKWENDGKKEKSRIKNFYVFIKNILLKNVWIVVIAFLFESFYDEWREKKYFITNYIFFRFWHSYAELLMPHKAFHSFHKIFMFYFKKSF